jgi:hypothetical protein
MTNNSDIERRTLLHTMAAASSTALSAAFLSRYAVADTADNPAPAASDPLRDGGDQDRRQYRFRQALRKRRTAAHGAWIPSNQPDVAQRGATSGENLSP